MSKIVPRKRINFWKIATPAKAANDPILSRRMGLETEYAVRSNQGHLPGAAKGLEYGKFFSGLATRIPIASSFRNPYRVFLANGGSVSLEHGGSASLEHALLEAATPECKSPRELLCYQIAIENLCVEVVQTQFAERGAQLLKGTGDAHGHTFGQHESYDVCIGKGFALLGWRVGLLLILPCLIAYRLLALAWFTLFWILHHAETLIMRLASRAMLFFRSDREDFVEHSWTFDESRSPRWIGICAWGIRCLHYPLAFALWLNIQCFALIPQRRFLTAFFSSRCIVDGAGYLDGDNRYWVSLRAASVNAIIGFGSYRNERPIFRCDSWLRGLCTETLSNFHFYGKLFRSVQRIEIATGDSGLCQQSQYVRMGATSLVLDLMDNPASPLPRLRNPVVAMGLFARDWMLLTRVADKSFRQWTALDLQHAYAAAVRQMLQAKEEVPIEAWEILDQWQTTLNQLRSTDDEANLPRSMLGRIDWLSKLWLLHQMKSDASWQVRKKIDLRYHELSSEGYFRRLAEMLHVAPILEPLSIERAQRTPPPGTRAIQRSYLIREFSNSDSQLKVSWTDAEFFVDGKKRRVKFSS